METQLMRAVSLPLGICSSKHQACTEQTAEMKGYQYGVFIRFAGDTTRSSGQSASPVQSRAHTARHWVTPGAMPLSDNSGRQDHRDA